MKRCTKCGEEKPLEEFVKDARKTSGRGSRCSQCAAEASRAWAKNNPEKARANCRAQRAKNPGAYREKKRTYRRNNPVRSALWAAKNRAVSMGVPFSLTFESVPPIPDTCPVLGIPLRSGGDTPIEFSPSLDRLRPELGYVDTNVAWISYRANRIKSDASLEELERVTEWTRQQLGTTHPVS